MNIIFVIQYLLYFTFNKLIKFIKKNIMSITIGMSYTEVIG